MPTYEYVCTKCDNHLEVYQSFSEEPLKKHAGCGGKLTKVMGSVGIVLKGSGFYRTDNRAAAKRDAKREGAGAKASGSESNGSGSSGSDSGSGSGGSKGDGKGDGKKAEPKPAAKSTDSSQQKSA